MMRDKDDVYVVNPGQGEGVTAADFAAIQTERNSMVEHDLPNIGPVQHHTDRRVRCARCNGQVFRFATTTDGQRHYCGTCVRAMTLGDKP